MTEKNYTQQQVIQKRLWITGKLFSIRVTRAPDFNFKAGQFARLGLCSKAPANPGEPDLWRAFSMVSTPDKEYLEFYAVIVPNGLFSPRMADLQVGDSIYVDKTVFGVLTIDQFPQGGTLWLLATGTGISTYLSIINVADTWQRFDSVILCHSVRTADEFAYTEQIQKCQDQWGSRFVYIPITTREVHAGMPQARLTTLIENNQLPKLTGHPLDPAEARVMLCGNPEMLTEARKLLSERGFAAGRRGQIGNLAVEKYW